MSGLDGGSYLLTASAVGSLVIEGLVWVCGGCKTGLGVSWLIDGTKGLNGLLTVTSGLDRGAIGLSRVTIGLPICISPSWLVSVVIGLVRVVPDPSVRLFQVDTEGLCTGGRDGGGNCLPFEYP